MTGFHNLQPSSIFINQMDSPMDKYFKSILFLLLILSFAHSTFSQSEITFIYKVYRSPEDFFNDKYVEADHSGGFGFKLNKDEVIKNKEVWGYKIRATESKDESKGYLIRPTSDLHFRNYSVVELPVVICGTLCLYFNGEFEHAKGNITQISSGDPVPCYVSLGLDGKIVPFTKMDKIVPDDTELLEAVKNVKKVRPPEQFKEYVDDRVNIVLEYNRKHPSTHTEFNLFEGLLDF